MTTHARWRWLAVAALAAAWRPAAAAEPEARRPILLATTTSTQDSGLLDELLPAFEAATGWRVKPISVGSGQAVALGRKGEADVLLVHSPADEEKLVADGLGVNRRLVMHNDFIVVGPLDDPAGVKGAATAREALARVARAGARFVSRGDRSGTHAKELALWKAAGLEPEGSPWYQQSGLGMGETLAIASEKGAYTLSDRGTWLALRLKRRFDLQVVLQGEPLLRNVYHVIEVNPAAWPRVNAAGARALAAWLVAPVAQAAIGRFGVDRFGEPLFVPVAPGTMATGR